ncbi:hypothetical protein BKK49_01315 [Rodentibacter rarus]|nr:hypothetical protein BKK49_01315 [Rodentibacter rarus]
MYIFLLFSCFFNFELEKGALVYRNNCQDLINLYISEKARDVISIEPGKNHVELFIIGDNIVPEEAFFIKNKKLDKLI